MRAIKIIIVKINITRFSKILTKISLVLKIIFNNKKTRYKINKIIIIINKLVII